jgi:hypothetical protein
MSVYKSRLKRLEGQRHRRLPPGQGHVTSVMQVPLDVPYDAWDTWVAQQPCRCGLVGCAARRIGLLIPAKCQTPEEWERHYAPR